MHLGMWTPAHPRERSVSEHSSWAPYVQHENLLNLPGHQCLQTQVSSRTSLNFPAQMILRWLILRVAVNAPEDTAIWLFHLNKLHRLSGCVLGFFQLPSPLLFPFISSYRLTASSTDSCSSTVVSIFEVILPRIWLSLMTQDAMSTSEQLFSYSGTAMTLPKIRARSRVCSSVFWDRARPPQGLKQGTAFLPLHTVCRISRGCHRNPVSMSESVCKENIRSSYYSVHLSLPINFPRDLFQVLAVHKIGVIGIQKSIANHQELGQVRSCQSR